MDFTGAQMVLTLKLISVAVCYQDGMKQDEVRRRCMAGISCQPQICRQSCCL